ncbi:MAG: hypothetical protein CMM86_11180 [Rhodovulum sp.]|nr:hypothetical protein [Rhodovulum sp.]
MLVTDGIGGLLHFDDQKVAKIVPTLVHNDIRQNSIGRQFTVLIRHLDVFWFYAWTLAIVLNIHVVFRKLRAHQHSQSPANCTLADILSQDLTILIIEFL